MPVATRSFAAVLLFLFIQVSLAQVGPKIISPEYNATIKAGDTVKIEYEYQNMGTGNYTADFQIYRDPSATDLDQNITTNHDIAPGNSTGTSLNYTLTDSYDWTVPDGLNETVYLVVYEHAKTNFFSTDLRSRPIMLHVSAGWILKPANALALLLLSLGVVSTWAF